MAKATKNIIPPVSPSYTVTLELTQNEAEYLRHLLGSELVRVPETLLGIWTALNKAGVLYIEDKSKMRAFEYMAIARLKS